MPDFSKFIGVLLVLLGIAFTTYGMSVLLPRQPVYLGRPLSSWVEDLCCGWGESQKRAVAAFGDMGEKALDPLVKMIGARDSRLKTALKTLAEYQTFIKFRFVEHEVQRQRAVRGFRALGPLANAAIPALTKLLDDPQTREAAVYALIGIGKEAALPVASMLTCNDPQLRENAAMALGSLRSSARAAVPALVKSLQTDNDEMGISVAIALAYIGQRPDLVVPALIQKLQTPNPTLRVFSLMALRTFGSQAKSAIPALETALEDQNEHVRSTAVFALQKIAPELAVEVGTEQQ
jgi:HEAT repeat protein